MPANPQQPSPLEVKFAADVHAAAVEGVAEPLLEVKDVFRNEEVSRGYREAISWVIGAATGPEEDLPEGSTLRALLERVTAAEEAFHDEFGDVDVLEASQGMNGSAKAQASRVIAVRSELKTIFYKEKTHVRRQTVLNFVFNGLGRHKPDDQLLVSHRSLRVPGRIVSVDPVPVVIGRHPITEQAGTSFAAETGMVAGRMLSDPEIVDAIISDKRRTQPVNLAF
jgi:hypothetical protein